MLLNTFSHTSYTGFDRLAISGYIHAMKRLKAFIAHIRKPENRKRYFWYWVGYQAVKGCITTSLIWIPAIYAALHLN